MSKIDPKWIQLDDDKLAIKKNDDDVNELTIRDDIILTGVSVEYVNGSKVQVRTVSQGVPTEDVGRDMKKDFWIQVPDFT